MKMESLKKEEVTLEVEARGSGLGCAVRASLKKKGKGEKNDEEKRAKGEGGRQGRRKRCRERRKRRRRLGEEKNPGSLGCNLRSCLRDKEARKHTEDTRRRHQVLWSRESESKAENDFSRHSGLKTMWGNHVC